MNDPDDIINLFKKIDGNYYPFLPELIDIVKKKGNKVNVENIFLALGDLANDYNSFITYPVRRQMIFLNDDFLGIYNYLGNYKDANNKFIIFQDYEKYSIALATFRFREENPSYSIEKAVEYILAKREEFKNKVIFGPNKNLIVFTHNETSFSNEAMIHFVKDRGVVNTGAVDLKGGTKKDIVINLISKSSGENVIWFSGHGLSESLELSSFGGAIDYKEFGDALIKRGNLKDVIIIIDACFSYDYAENLINYLKDKKITRLPTIITETNKGSYGYGGHSGSLFLDSLINVQKSGPLLGGHIYEAEQYSWNTQDSAVFFSSEGETPLEIATNYIPEDCCGGTCSFPEKTSLSKPTLFTKVKNKISSWFS